MNVDTNVEPEAVKQLADYLMKLLDSRIREVVCQTIENRIEEIADAAADAIDLDKISETVLSDFDYDEMVDRVNRELDVSQIAEEVQDNLDMDDLAQNVKDHLNLEAEITEVIGDMKVKLVRDE